MRPIKRILANEGVRRVLCAIGAFYIWFVRITTRWDVVNDAEVSSCWDRGKPFIAAFWHGRLLMMPACWRRGIPVAILISEHRDGRLIAQTIAHFGVGTITGSSTRGGSGALRRMMAMLKDGGCVGITPDGPRGPRMRASGGVVAAAKLSGVPVVPVTYSVARRKVLGSWDRFLIAWPFNRGVVVWGNPVSVARDADDAALETARLAIEDELIRISNEADKMVGQPTIDPAPRSAAEVVS